MSEWKETTLSSVADIDSGFAFKSKEYTNNGNLRVVRGKNVTVGTMRWGSDAKFWDYPTVGLERYFLEKNDIVIGMDGSKIGENRSKIKEVDLPAILAQRVGRVRAKDGNSQEFLWQAINSPSFVQYIKSIHTGTSIPHISQKQIGNFEVLIPSPSEQKLIASVLSSLVDKIGLLHRQNQILEQMAETLFRQWFVEEADDNWEEVLLEDLIVLKQGKYIRAEEISEAKSEEFKFPLYGGNGIRGYLNTYKYDSPKVAITCRGNGCGLIQLLVPFSTVSNSCIVFDNAETISTWFLYYYSKVLDFASVTSGSAQPQITITDIGKLELILPDKTSLEAFYNQVNIYHQKVLSNQTQIRTLTALRDTLLPKLMSGEVRVEMDATTKMEEA